MRCVRPLALLLLLAGAEAAATTPPARPAPMTPLPPASPAPACEGEYADEITALRPSVREFERDPANRYSYCLRTSAVYECLSYASDGSVRRTRKAAQAHGTGFAYRRSGGDTFVLTNEHVAAWPAVTDEAHAVEDVPAGCKLVSDTVRIVDDEDDDDDANDVVLQRVVVDPALDVAILKARAPLRTIPYRVGRSAALHVGNAVAVHGYPLGAFAATNSGKVVTTFDRDTDKEWDHVDFVVDALLSPGNSGSPVLAVSCRTGEYELVGVYHAGYVRGSALNVVVGIDQVKELMTTLRRAPRADTRGEPSATDRQALDEALARTPIFHFPLGPLVAAAHRGPGGALFFEVYSKGFPLRDERLLVVEDLAPGAAGSAFGAAGRAWTGGAPGLRPLDVPALDAEGQAQLARALARLRADAAAAARWRAEDAASSKGRRRRRAVEQALTRAAESDRDAAQAIADLAERFGPRPGDGAALSPTAVLPAPTPATSTTAARPDAPPR